MYLVKSGIKIRGVLRESTWILAKESRANPRFAQIFQDLKSFLPSSKLTFMHWHALYLRMKLQNSAGLPLRMLRKQRLKITFSSIDMTYRTSILTPTVMLNYVICPCISTCRNFCQLLSNVDHYFLRERKLFWTSKMDPDNTRTRSSRIVYTAAAHVPQLCWLWSKPFNQHAIHGDCAGGYRIDAQMDAQ